MRLWHAIAILVALMIAQGCVRIAVKDLDVPGKKVGEVEVEIDE